MKTALHWGFAASADLNYVGTLWLPRYVLRTQQKSLDAEPSFKTSSLDAPLTVENDFNSSEFF